MGILDKLTQKAETEKQKHLQSILMDGEELKKIMIGAGDYVAITNKRVIILDQSFDWGDSKHAIYSINPSKITAVSMVNPLFGMVRKFKVAVFVGSVKMEATFLSPESCRECYDTIVKLTL